MKIGAMNSPDRDVIKEIKVFGNLGFDFIDLAIEGPKAYPEKLSDIANEIKELLSSYSMSILGHIPWYFEIGHPYKEIRKAFLKEALKVIEIAKILGIQKIGLHILQQRGLFQDKLEHNISGIKEIVKEAREHGIFVCIENTDILSFNVQDFKKIFEDVPEAKFLYDIGHANIALRQEDEIFIFLKEFKDRLAHVHVHDNTGAEDLHLPIGTGAIDWKKATKEIKNVYDGTITLEIHSKDRDYLKLSKDKFLSFWGK
jgi:sugar phosphate isomerase/epimerase